MSSHREADFSLICLAYACFQLAVTKHHMAVNRTSAGTYRSSDTQMVFVCSKMSMANAEKLAVADSPIVIAWPSRGTLCPVHIAVTLIQRTLVDLPLLDPLVLIRY